MRATEALGASSPARRRSTARRSRSVAEGPLADLAARVAGLGPPRCRSIRRRAQATLRPYQQRGLAWLAAMCAGLGGCLADDMGLGKTIQIIALHLRAGTEGRADARGVPGVAARHLGARGPPVRPDVPVRRYHGGGRHLQDLAVDEIVLVTYGVVLRDSVRLAEIGWGLVVADEAQHVKNPLSRTARELRALPAPPGSR